MCDLRVNIRRLTKRSVKTSTTIAYYKLSTFDVTAGTGRFNGSLVEPLVAEYEQQIPFGVLASTYNFVTNSQFSVTFQSPSCPESSSQCDSYLLPGGTYLMYPPFATAQSISHTVIIHDAPGTQINFTKGLDPGDEFLADECSVYGSDESLVGVYFCMAMSRKTKGAIRAGETLAIGKETSRIVNADQSSRCISVPQRNTRRKLPSLEFHFRLQRIHNDDCIRPTDDSGVWREEQQYSVRGRSRRNARPRRYRHRSTPACSGLAFGLLCSRTSSPVLCQLLVLVQSVRRLQLDVGNRLIRHIAKSTKLYPVEVHGKQQWQSGRCQRSHRYLARRISNDCFPQRTIHEICTQSHRFHDIHSPTGTGVDILLGGFLLASLFRPPAPEYLVIPAGRLRQQIAYDFAR